MPDHAQPAVRPDDALRRPRQPRHDRRRPRVVGTRRRVDPDGRGGLAGRRHAGDLRAGPAVDDLLDGRPVGNRRTAVARHPHAGHRRRRQPARIIVDARHLAQRRSIERWLFVLAAPLLVLLLDPAARHRRPAAARASSTASTCSTRSPTIRSARRCPRMLLALGVLLGSRLHRQPAGLGERLLAARHVSPAAGRARSWAPRARRTRAARIRSPASTTATTCRCTRCRRPAGRSTS